MIDTIKISYVEAGLLPESPLLWPAVIEEWMNDVQAQESMRKILHRKAVSDGKALLNSSNGRPRPIVQLIQSKGLKRLKAGDNPVAIVHDLQAQLKLVI